DVAATVDQLHEAADSGLRGVTCPTPAAGMPPLIDPVYEPIWEAAEQRGLPLHAHIGWGGLAVDDLPFTSIMSAAGRGVVMAEMRWLSRRCLWLLTYAGVFERHPDLKLVFVEQQADWVPNQLALLDENYDDYQRGHVLRAELPHRPSDYWRRQCFVGASSIARAEVEMRAAIGVETMLFGTDYPHFEATWPNTTLWLKRAFAGVPEAEVRLVLGDNAIRCYGLDRAQLQAAADRVGPLVSDVTGGEDDLDEATARWLDERGLARPAICM
ncbi:MAG TPA: amidohydrolase family protein, partial [Acidimicrobiales bacterium]|nr:amidohydrolase family protein [Acidimicrobiales bacterium]